MALFDGLLKRLRTGRPPKAPQRDTMPYPSMNGPGPVASKRQALFRPTPRNLRMFGRTPIARRAINTIRNPISMMEWEVVPREGVTDNSEIRRQCDVVTNCLASPNTDDSFHTLIAQVVEDVMHGAGAIEHASSPDLDRPLWMWPVDGLSIQIYPLWDGSSGAPRYVQAPGGLSGFDAVRGVPLRNDELIYIRPNPSTDTPFGHGPLEIAFQTISRQLGVADFAGKLSSNALPPFGINLSGADPATVSGFRSYWQNDIEGQGKVPIWGREGQVNADGKSMGDGVVRLYPTGDAALFLAYQEFLKREIACAFDISPQNLGIERDVNRNTSEVAEDRDWDQAIVPMARMVASHFNREAIRGRLGFTQIEFRFKGLVREDELAAAQIDQIRYNINSITPNEIRVKRGEPELDSPWSDMVIADVEIAKNAARSAGLIEDPNLPKQAAAAPAEGNTPSNPKPAKEPEKSK